MSDLNSVNLSGRLCADPELKFLPNGTPKTQLRIACSRQFTTDGERREDTVFIDVDVWSKQAENCSKYLKKGSRVIVAGDLKMDQWEAQDGTKRTKIYVRANSVLFLDKREDSEGSGSSSSGGDQRYQAKGQRRDSPRRDREAQSERQGQQSATPAGDAMDGDDIPF